MDSHCEISNIENRQRSSRSNLFSLFLSLYSIFIYHTRQQKSTKNIKISSNFLKMYQNAPYFRQSLSINQLIHKYDTLRFTHI